MQALAALTPPLLVCAVVVIAIVAFLRHEMGRSRTGRSVRADESEVAATPGSADLDKKQSELTDVARPSAGDSESASRRLR
jgi:hypothetical protein